VALVAASVAGFRVGETLRKTIGNISAGRKLTEDPLRDPGCPWLFPDSRGS
jgi:hypothetical protein